MSTCPFLLPAWQQQGWASFSPIQDLRPHFDPNTGLCTKAFNAFEVKTLLSLCVWGLAHTKERAELCPFMFIGWILSL